MSSKKDKTNTLDPEIYRSENCVVYIKSKEYSHHSMAEIYDINTGYSLINSKISKIKGTLI